MGEAGVFKFYELAEEALDYLLFFPGDYDDFFFVPLIGTFKDYLLYLLSLLISLTYLLLVLSFFFFSNLICLSISASSASSCSS